MEIDITSLMKQVKQFEAEMENSQSKLEEITATGSAGADMVSVTVNGLNKVLEIKISDELFDVGDKKMLEDLTAAAVNDAIGKAQSAIKKEMGKIASGFKGIPGFPNFT